MSSLNGKTGIACGFLAALLLLTTALELPAFAGDPLRDQSRRIRNVSSWKMTFRYDMDVSFTNEFGGMSEEIIRFIESEGTVLFTRGSQRDLFAGEGTADYNLEYYTLLQADGLFSGSSQSGEKYKMLNTEAGSGSTSIIKEEQMNVLEFDFTTYTYMFRIVPGEDHEYDFGLPTRSVMDMKIIDPLIGETAEEVAKTIDRDKLKAMFPEQVEWEEFFSSFSVEAFGIPLPFFDTKLCGSITDSQGGVVTWIIEPATGESDEDEYLPETGIWYHHHPAEYSEQNAVKSAWNEIRRAAANSGSQGGVTISSPIEVYLLDKSGSGTGIPIGTGDVLVAVDASETVAGDSPVDAEQGGLFAGLVADALEQAPSAPDASSRIQTALYALFYYNFAAGPNDPRNVIQDYPLALDLVQFEGDTVLVRMLGPFEPESQEDTERIREQIRYTVAENSEKDLTVNILLNQHDF